MVTFDSSELTLSVHAVMRHAAALSFGTRVFPYSSSVIWDERRAARAGPLLQWLLERATFEARVVAQYGELAVGEVRELIAGTGVGKTTVMPYLIARSEGCNGLVLMPHDIYPLRTFRYLRHRFAQLGGEVSVAQLRTSHYSVPPAAPCIFLSTASGFLGRLAARPSLLRDLAIEFIYLDESHEKVPAYTMFKYLVSSGIVSGCKVFYGTATGAADVSMEGSALRKVVKVPPSQMMVENPGAVTAASPLHYTRIVGRTLVVLASDTEVTSWDKYYDSHDVPVLGCRMMDGTKVDMSIDVFLDSHPLCVVLATHVYRTSVTLPKLDVVVCGGYVTRVRTDFSTATVRLVREPVTRSLQVQTLGRVGRTHVGTAYYSDVEVSAEEDGLDDDSAFYVYLWAQVFSLRINDPAIARFSDVTGSISTFAAAILLHSRLPPALVLPYVGNSGFYSGWANVASYMLYTVCMDGREDSGDPPLHLWSEYSTGIVPYANEPVTYKSAVQYPKQWQVVPAYAWTLLSGVNTEPRAMRARSVISAVSTQVPTRTARDSTFSLQSTLRDPVRSVGARGLRAPQRGSVGSGLTGQEGTVRSQAHLRVPSYTDIQDALSARNSLPVVRTPPPPAYQSRQSLMVRPEQSVVQRGHARSVSDSRTIELWRDDVRARPVVLVGSDSSDERFQIKLKQVDPVKYKMHKLYPMDSEYFEKLVENELVKGQDEARLDKLLNGTRNIVSLDGDASARAERQGQYFLSVIRIHNAAVAKRAQMAANVKPSIGDKFIMGLNGNITRATKDIEESARMLKAFELQSWFVGIDKRAPRSSQARDACSSVCDISISPDYDYDEARAQVMLAFGPEAVIRAIEKFVSLSKPYRIEGQYVANAWLLCDKVVACSHVYDDVKEVLHESASAVLDNTIDDDVIIMSSTLPSTGPVSYRQPTESERVYVLTYDVAQRKVVVLGDYTLAIVQSDAFLHAHFAHGASGALVVSVSDGALLGLYSAYYGRVGETPLSYVVSVGKFLKYIY